MLYLSLLMCFKRYLPFRHSLANDYQVLAVFQEVTRLLEVPISTPGFLSSILLKRRSQND